MFQRWHSSLFAQSATVAAALHANRPLLLLFIRKNWNCKVHHFLPDRLVFQGNSYPVVGVCLSKCQSCCELSLVSICKGSWREAKWAVFSQNVTVCFWTADYLELHLINQHINSVYLFCARADKESERCSEGGVTRLRSKVNAHQEVEVQDAVSRAGAAVGTRRGEVTLSDQWERRGGEHRWGGPAALPLA